MTDDKNRRRHDRVEVDASIEIYHKGYSIELPTRDISLSGVGLESCGVDHLAPGDQCMVILPGDVEVAAVVVSVRKDSVHLRFSPEGMEEIKYFIEVNRP
jgi:hypothetical protein